MGRSLKSGISNCNIYKKAYGEDFYPEVRIDEEITKCGYLSASGKCAKKCTKKYQKKCDIGISDVCIHKSVNVYENKANIDNIINYRNNAFQYIITLYLDSPSNLRTKVYVDRILERISSTEINEYDRIEIIDLLYKISHIYISEFPLLQVRHVKNYIDEEIDYFQTITGNPFSLVITSEKRRNYLLYVNSLFYYCQKYKKIPLESYKFQILYSYNSAFCRYDVSKKLCLKVQYRIEQMMKKVLNTDKRLHDKYIEEKTSAARYPYYCNYMENIFKNAPFCNRYYLVSEVFVSNQTIGEKENVYASLIVPFLDINQ